MFSSIQPSERRIHGIYWMDQFWQSHPDARIVCDAQGSLLSRRAGVDLADVEPVEYDRHRIAEIDLARGYVKERPDAIGDQLRARVNGEPAESPGRALTFQAEVPDAAAAPGPVPPPAPAAEKKSIFNSAASLALAVATGKRVSTERMAARLVVCQGCPNFRPIGDDSEGMCDCGCPLKAKARFRNLAAYKENRAGDGKTLGWGCHNVSVVDGVVKSRWEQNGV